MFVKRQDEQKTEAAKGSRSNRGNFYYFDDPMVLSCAEIIADNRLGPLADSHDRHQAEHQHPIHDTEGRHRQYAAISQ